MLTERFEEALGFAARTHRTQSRKGVPTPYVGHLLGVAALIIDAGGDEDQAIAALLHDAVEDQGGTAMETEIRARFGHGVAAIVMDCTDTLETPKPDWRPRKEQYLAGLAHKPARSLAVSLADKLNNATAILRDLRAHGDRVWDRFTGGRDGSLWYYRALADAFRTLAPGAYADELHAVVTEIERFAAQPR